MAKKVRSEETQASWVDRFAQFTQTDLYKEYVETLRDERELIIAEGEKSLNPHALSELRGFDKAASFFERQVQIVKRAVAAKTEEDNVPEY